MSQVFKLNDRVSANNDVDPEDAKKLKRALMRLDFLEAPELGVNGFVDTPLLEGVKSLQKEMGLREDGIVNPGGPTETMIATRLKRQEKNQDRARNADDDQDSIPDVRAPGSVPLRVRGAKQEKSPKAAPFPSRRFVDKWKERGFGGPRGILHVPTLRISGDRISNILANEPALFNIEANPDANDAPRILEIQDIGSMAIERFGKLIEKESKEQGVDPTLVKAIMFAENSRGYYGHLFESIGMSNSILPMNIRQDIWSHPGLVQGNFHDPSINIEAGVKLIKRISDRIQSPSPEKVASIWHSAGREKVDDFGAYVGRVYKEKPWKNLKRPPDQFESLAISP